MFESNELIAKFVAGNAVGLGILYGILRILAKRSKTTLDDSILGFLGGFIPGKKPPAEEEKTP